MQRALKAFSARFSVLRAQLTHTHQLFSSHPQIRQGEQRGQLSCVFHQPTQAHFPVAKLTLDDPKRMLDFGPCLSFAVLNLALDLVENTALIEPGIRAAPRRDLPDDLTISCSSRLSTPVYPASA